MSRQPGLVPPPCHPHSFLRGALGLAPRYRVVVVSPNGAQLERVAALVAEGKVKPVIAAVMPLEQAGWASAAGATTLVLPVALPAATVGCSRSPLP